MAWSFAGCKRYQPGLSWLKIALHAKGQRWLALAFGESWVLLAASAATAACTTTTAAEAACTATAEAADSAAD